jgi:tetratricopeptide (TPR) repeat protein
MRLLRRALASIGVAVCLFTLPVVAQSPVALRSQEERDVSGSQSSRAEAELLRALKESPQDGSLWFSLGVSRAQLKKIDPAIEAFEKALPLYAEPAAVYFNLGLLYMEKNDLTKAEDAYRRGLVLAPSHAAANQNYALLLMQREDFRDALIPLERLREIRPGDVSTRATLVEAYLKAGLKSKGENEMDDLMNSHLATLPDGLALAKLLLSDREADAARRVLEYLRGSWPTSAAAHGELGLLLSGNAEYSAAAEELKQAVQLDPDSVRFSQGLGEALIGSGQYPAALQFLLAARKKFVNQPNFQYQLAVTDVCLQRFPEAISVLENLARERPNSGKVQFLLGGSYELDGELQKAEDHYRSAIQLAPQEPTYYRVLGSLLQKQGPEHLAESIQLLRKALVLDPTDGESKIVLARCLEKQGVLDEAAALLEQAVASNPASRRAHSALAELYRRQNKLAQAEQEQSIAAKLEDQKMKDWDIWGSPTMDRP